MRMKPPPKIVTWLKETRLRAILASVLLGAGLVLVLSLVYRLACPWPRAEGSVCSAIAKNPPWTLLTSIGSAPALILLWLWRTVHKDEDLAKREREIRQRDAELEVTRQQAEDARKATEAQHALALREERSKRFL